MTMFNPEKERVWVFFIYNIILRSWAARKVSSAHCPTLPSLHLRHNSFSNPSELILQPFRWHEIPPCKKDQIAQFADDTCLFYQSRFKSIPTSIRFLQRALDQLNDWFARWNIKINATKTEAIVFQKVKKKVEAPIKIQNCIIPYSPSVKYLGITLDSKLTFQNHITKTVNKAYGALSTYYIHFSKLAHYLKGRKSHFMWP